MRKIIFVIMICVVNILASCELVDVLDQNPPNNLIPENVVQNEEDAIAVLNGAYSTVISYSNSYYYMYSELIPGALSGSMSYIGGADPHTQFVENRLLPDNTHVNAYWTIIYKVLNGANHAIALVEEKPDSFFEKRTKLDLIGEARFLRAMATFDILRYWGEFYDMESKRGIILRTEPVNFVKRDKVRSTVRECYEQVLADLDFALLHAPDFTVPYRASKIAAKALKARVLLFAGRYADAAQAAREVIDDNTQVRTLENTFAEAFSKGLASREMILMTHRHSGSDVEDNNRKRYYAGRPGTTWMPTYLNNDPRKALSYSGTTILKVNHAATFRPTYFIRLAEMYLIEAEGLAFSGAGLDEIKVPLNVIRNRATIGNSPATTLEEVKEDIFAEYVRELMFENGSEWFAAIRFDKIMTLQPSITTRGQLILPIPQEEIDGNGLLGTGDQNQAYL
jgi:hypothetical protein